MTPNKPTTLREEFEKDFDNEWPSVRSYTAGKMQEWIGNWWLSKFTSHNTELLQKIEGLRRENPAPQWDAPKNSRVIYAHSRRDGYNQAIDEVINLINQNK